jgi:hypothetical protein
VNNHLLIGRDLIGVFLNLTNRDQLSVQVGDLILVRLPHIDQLVILATILPGGQLLRSDLSKICCCFFRLRIDATELLIIN